MEEAIAPHIPPEITMIPKQTFIETMEKLNAGIAIEDIAKLADQLFNKEIDCVELEKLCEEYKNFAKSVDAEAMAEAKAGEKAEVKEDEKDGYEVCMEEVRKAVAETFCDICEVFKEFDPDKSQLLTLSQFEAALGRIKTKLTTEQIRSLFKRIDKANTGKISYTRFASEIESYSLSKVPVAPNTPSMEVIKKLRYYIKNHSKNTMELVFKDLVRPNLDGKRWVTKKDFKGALARTEIVLSAAQFDDFAAFLDPSHADQVDYDYLCEVLGYIQPLEKAAEEKQEPKVEEADNAAMVRMMVDEVASAARKNECELKELFVNKDFDRNGTVSKINFMEIIRTARGGIDYNDREYLILTKHFEDPITHNIQYNGFLSQADQALHKFRQEKKVTNLQWAAKMLDEISVFLFYKGQTSYEYFRAYGLNPENKSVTFEGFEQGVNDMGIDINPGELNKLKEDLDTDGDRTISAEELAMYLDERRDQVLERYKKEVMDKIEGFVRARNVNLQAAMQKHDSYSTRRISPFDFETELRGQFKGLLRDLQYKYLTARYRVDSDRVAYMDFISDVNSGKLSEEEARNQRTVLIGKLRENIRLLNLKAIEQLLKNNSDKKIYNVSMLLDVFPRSLLPMNEYTTLERMIDPGRSGKFTLDDFCDLFWTNQDEEESRGAAHEAAMKLCRNVKRFCTSRSIELRSLFAGLDASNTGWLSSEDIKKTFFRVGLRLSYKQLSALLYYQNIRTDERWFKNYNDLVQRIEEDALEEASVHESATEQVKEEAKSEVAIKEEAEEEKAEDGVEEQKEVVQKEVRLEPPKEVELSEEMVEYLAEQFEVLRRYLQDKGVDIKAEFSRYEENGYTEFSVFCHILSSHDVDLDNQDVLNAFYSYLKEEQEGKISMKRLYDALLRGKRLTQYRPKSAVKATQKEELEISRTIVNKLADFMEEKNIPLSTLKKNAVNGKTLRKEQLNKTLKEIDFPFFKEDLDVLFKTIAIRDETTGSAAHLMTIINEQLAKKSPKKLKLDNKDKETLAGLNKEIVAKNMSRAEMKRLLDVNGDGYIDKEEFSSTLIKNSFKGPKDKLIKAFLALDVHDIAALSIDYLLLHITGLKHGADDKQRHLPIDEQIALEAEKLFERLDDSHNGVVVNEDLFKAIAASSRNKCTREEVDEIARTLDTKQNNFIPKEVFLEYMVERIKDDTIAAEDDMLDLKEQLNNFDLDDSGSLTPDEVYAILSKECPAIQMEDLEEIFAKVDFEREGRVDIDDFIDYVRSPGAQTSGKAVLTLKYQRRLTPNEFMTCYAKMSKSALYTPSFVLQLHAAGRNLPSESFKLVRNVSGLGYVDIEPALDANNKPVNMLRESEPGIAGYVTLSEATGVPIPDEGVLPRENVVGRMVKAAFYNNKNSAFVCGSATVLAAWSGEEEDVWTFNDAGKVGTNPLAVKWGEAGVARDIDIVFEFVASIK